MATRAELEEAARVIGKRVRKLCPPDTGFTVFTFDFGEKGNMAYVSNCERADMIRLVEEWLAYQKAGLRTDPPGPRGQG